MALNGDRPRTPLSREFPPLRELSSEPDWRELAEGYANVILFLRQQWPALIDAVLAKPSNIRTQGDKQVWAAFAFTGVFALIAILSLVYALGAKR
jgi:hypothetical protein